MDDWNSFEMLKRRLSELERHTQRLERERDQLRQASVRLEAELAVAKQQLNEIRAIFGCKVVKERN